MTPRSGSPFRTPQSPGIAPAFQHPHSIPSSVRIAPEALAVLRRDYPAPRSAGGETGLQHALRRNKLALLVCTGALELSSAEAERHERWLAAYRLRTTAINLASLRATVAASEVLDRSSVPHVTFKGPLQHERLYGTAMARPSGDADILAPPHAFRLAQRALGAVGWTPTDRQGLWWRVFLGERHLERDGHAAVDLHAHLRQPGSPGPRGASSLLDRARRQRWAGHSVPVPDAVDDALIASVNVAKALWHREAAGGSLLDWRMATLRASRWRERADKQGLGAVADLVDRTARAVLDGPADADDERLIGMALAPWAVGDWPRRRSLLRTLCGSRGSAYWREAARVGLAEGVRVATAPRRTARAMP